MTERFRKDRDREDLRWVRKAKQGDKKSFENLVVRHQRSIYMLIRKMVLSHEETHDLVQDTFLKAYMHLSQFDEKYVFYPWLHRIAVNTAINYLNLRKRRNETFLKDESDIADETGTERDPASAAERRDIMGRMRNAMAQLPEDQRIVFILRTCEEFSYQEISDQLQISMGTVMSRLARAREKLRALMMPYINHETEE